MHIISDKNKPVEVWTFLDRFSLGGVEGAWRPSTYNHSSHFPLLGNRCELFAYIENESAQDQNQDHPQPLIGVFFSEERAQEELLYFIVDYQIEKRVPESSWGFKTKNNALGTCVEICVETPTLTSYKTETLEFVIIKRFIDPNTFRMLRCT